MYDKVTANATCQLKRTIREVAKERGIEADSLIFAALRTAER
jgi:hypothetical protein